MKVLFAQGQFVLFLWVCLGLVPAGFAQTSVPRPDHVVIVMEENTSLSGVLSASSLRYMHSLIAQGALFTSSFALTHPSEPNYLALFSGSMQGVGDDSCPHTFSAPNLGSQLIAAGLSFAGYSEGLPYAGATRCKSGGYVRRHCPWVNFSNLPRTANLPFSRFPTNFNELPTICFIIPTLQHDLHSGSGAAADNWLLRHVGPYVQWAATNNSLLIVSWDEGDRAHNQIATFFVGPMVRPGRYCERITHYTVLRTLEVMYGLAPLGGAGRTEPITSPWTPDSIQPPVTVELSSPIDGLRTRAPTQIDLVATASASGSAIHSVEFFQRTKKLGEVTNSPFAFTWTNPPPGDYCFVAHAKDELGRTKWSRSVGVSIVAPDLIAPTVTIAAPVSGSRLTNAQTTVRGTARDNEGVARVEYRLGTGAFQTAAGTTNWMLDLSLAPGPNVVSVRSVDLSGNPSATAAATLIFVVTSPLQISIAGAGRVRPDLNQRVLEAGQSYTVTAVAAPGYLFAGWSGGTNSDSSRLTFLMQPNLVLQATFVPNPFLAVQGNYSGLFFETNVLRVDSSGRITVTTTGSGAYSGSLQWPGSRRSFTGHFDLSGHASNRLSGPRSNLLTVELALDLSDGASRLKGRVVDVAWVADLQANRGVFDSTTQRAPWADRYTMTLPDDDTVPLSPAGDGVGSVTVTMAGMIRLAGTLADGTPLTQAVSVSGHGDWPLFAPLYAGRGLFLGWLKFTNGLAPGFGGRMSWIKPAVATTRFYPHGFTNQSDAVGSVYHPPAGSSEGVVNFIDGQILFSEGNLAATFTNLVSFGANNRIINRSSNAMTLTFHPSTGRWNGFVIEPVTGRRLSVTGAVLQNQDIGAGYCLGTNLSGSMLLQAR